MIEKLRMRIALGDGVMVIVVLVALGAFGCALCLTLLFQVCAVVCGQYFSH